MLGTDGFGRSDTRPAPRRFFRIDKESIAIAVLSELARGGALPPDVVQQALTRYGIEPGPSQTTC